MAPGPTATAGNGTDVADQPFVAQSLGVDTISVNLAVTLKNLGDNGVNFSVTGELYLTPTPEDHLVGLLAGRLDDPLDFGIVTLAFVEITVGVHSFNGSKWFTGNVTGVVAVNPLGPVEIAEAGNATGDGTGKRSITELEISLTVTFDTSVGSWAFEAEMSFKKGQVGNLWLEISAFGSATSSKGGACPDSGWYGPAENAQNIKISRVACTQEPRV
jgi:hypothetical protein